MDSLFNNIYYGKKVFLTGHTGFKGSWLALWLTQLGAEVVGFSLEAPSNPNHYELLDIPITSIRGDIRDADALTNALKKHRPDIVFHLAAQALVRDSYSMPVETFATNIMGTLNVLEGCRQVDSVKAIVNVTSDKCYRNDEHIWGYRETDPMGGNDPYSASKGAVELVAQSYRHSFFSPAQYGQSHTTLLANARAGNVIGGGDWAKDRLVPDMIRARAEDEPVIIRNPRSIRPWQHVLEPVSGYLHLGQKLLEGNIRFADNWNFGPDNDSLLTVVEVVEHLQQHINGLEYEIKEDPNNPHEATLLQVDSTKARVRMGWKPVWDSATALAKTAHWYKDYYNDGKVISEDTIADYISDAKEAGVEWATS